MHGSCRTLLGGKLEFGDGVVGGKEGELGGGVVVEAVEVEVLGKGGIVLLSGWRGTAPDDGFGCSEDCFFLGEECFPLGLAGVLLRFAQRGHFCLVGLVHHAEFGPVCLVTLSQGNALGGTFCFALFAQCGIALPLCCSVLERVQFRLPSGRCQ